MQQGSAEKSSCGSDGCSWEAAKGVGNGADMSILRAND